VSSVGNQLVVGIGSGHGDDRAGWHLSDALRERDGLPAEFRKASVPHDLIDWLDGIDTIHLADAWTVQRELRRFEMIPPSGPEFGIRFRATSLPVHDREERSNAQWESVPALRCSSSHQMDFAATMQLAGVLGRLPRCVVLWTIPARQMQPGQSISTDCLAQVRQCAALIAKEICHA